MGNCIVIVFYLNFNTQVQIINIYLQVPYFPDEFVLFDIDLTICKYEATDELANFCRVPKQMVLQDDNSNKNGYMTIQSALKYHLGVNPMQETK